MVEIKAKNVLVVEILKVYLANLYIQNDVDNVSYPWNFHYIIILYSGFKNLNLI